MIEEEESESETPKFESTSRVRSFFNFEPVDVIDDAVNAVAVYAADVIVSLTTCLKEDGFPDNEVTKIKNKLNQRVAEELNKNSELFILYLLRNVFNIPASVDLAAAYTAPSTHNDDDLSKSDISHEEPITGVSEDQMKAIDTEIDKMLAQINGKYDEYVEMCKSIRANETEAVYLDKILERLNKIESIVDRVNELPTDRLENVNTKLKECIQETESMIEKTRKDANSSIEQHKRSFDFD